MKKSYFLLVIPVLLAALLLILYARSFQTVRLGSNMTGIVTYCYGGITFEEPLTQEQLTAVLQIIDGKKMSPQSITGIPNCPFSEDIAIILGERRFLLACDTCDIMQDGETKRYFEISESERQTLEAIFTAHGGTFPCI